MKKTARPALILLAALAAGFGEASAAGFKDPLDQPAQVSALAARSPLTVLARAGTRLVAAGSRGHVLLSDDEGKTWAQAKVPVSSDLVSLSFPDAQHGWAVGHDGVILASADGGKTWTRQFDGRQVGERGAENSLLDVCFVDAKQGWAVGAFGQILATDDGGKTWQSLPAERADNPKALHLYAVRSIAGSLYIVGEQGLALKFNERSGRFEALSLPYQGTLFGITGDAGMLLVHGLRGHALRSGDGGRNWQEIATGLKVGLTASARSADGAWLLASQAGHVLISRDAGSSFRPVKVERAPPAAGLATLGGKGQPQGLLIVGPRGAQTLTLP